MALTTKQKKELVALVRVRSSQKARLVNIANYVEAIDEFHILDNKTIEGLKSRGDTLANTYSEFLDTQLQIDLFFDDVPAEHVQERTDFDNTFFDLDSKIKSLITSPSVAANVDSIAGSSHGQHLPSQIAQVPQVQVKLPKISLSIFGGKAEDWLEFRDTYVSLIHNNQTISNIERFHYLRSSLAGEASLVIASVEFSDSAYIQAWDLLCNRYNNSRILIHKHVRAIFSFEAIHRESSSKIRALLDNLSKHMAALTILKEPTSQWDTLIIYLATSKLDAQTAREWEEKQLELETVSLQSLVDFLTNKANVLEAVQVKRVDKNYNNSYNYKQPCRSLATTSNATCIYCEGEHIILNCERFVRLTPNERRAQVRTLKLCINCLKPGHQIAQCKTNYRCRKCHRKHNTLLHFDSPHSSLNTNLNQSETQSSAQIVTNIVSASCHTSNAQVVLATALVSVPDSRGSLRTLRALLDCASQSSFITQRAVDVLDCSLQPISITVVGALEKQSQLNRCCELQIKALNSNFEFKTKCLVAPSITSQLPSTQINIAQLQIPSHIRLADPQFYEPSQIDILLGADCFWQLLSIGQISLGQNMPILQKTRLGWVVSGSLMNSLYNINTTVCNLSRNDSVDESLKRFWEIEEIPFDKSPYSLEEKQCEDNFVATTTRDARGRFIVKLPLKNIENLGASKEIAMSRFLSLEKKLNKNPRIKEKYEAFMQQYIDLGHMCKIDSNSTKQTSENEISYYLPHHAVQNENSETTRLRVVFDGSCKSSTGISLNDCQMVGPVIQDNLFAILTRFRKHKFVVTADIEKMYRQVLLHPVDRPLHRILWRNNSNGKIDTFELQTVTYGTASASFVSIRCLKAIAEEFQETEPEVARIIREDFYVDDLITGADDIESLYNIQSKITTILASGCFELHKWHSNVKSLPTSESPQKTTCLSFDHQAASKTLGMKWSPERDSFSFEIANIDTRIVTKRSILSRISQIFDPLGLLAPCVIVGKIILQKLWLERLSWDESVSSSIHTQWLNFSNSLPALNSMAINRYIISSAARTELQMHGFCDASEVAYGACLYIRSVSSNNNINCNLLCAKTRVAPLKKLTIPRLELAAAELLVKLVNKAMTAINLNFESIHCWSDSTIVLGWLKLPANKLTTFVSNRVATIQNQKHDIVWHHVPTKENPADMLSRGIAPNELIRSTMWWSGPGFVKQNDSTWPKMPANASMAEPQLPELRKIGIIKALVNSTTTCCSILDFSKYSSFDKIVRILLVVFRFIRFIRKQPSIEFMSEIEAAKKYVLQEVQKQAFAVEIETLKKTKSLGQASRLISLAPFLHNDGLLRVGGRIGNNVDLRFNHRHPILLPAKHHVSRLILTREHVLWGHIGPLSLLNTTRLRYWPITGRALAKQIVRNCQTCFRAKPRPFPPPMMGNLPTERIREALPFSYCGVDYAGPIELKASQIRNAKTYKAYIALFVCMSTKAMHLELVTNLSTEAFIAALRRFWSRRGIPMVLYSDNGTNFVGAARELAEYFKSHRAELEAACAFYEVKWIFSPPRSPHFGGIWEAGVKSVKYHVKRIIGDRRLTYESYYTFLVQIEAIVNSRPLTPLSTDPNDLAPLTPAHFLIGRSLNSHLDHDLSTIKEARLSQYQAIQAMVQSFWRRWKRDYINTLQQRTKWNKNQTSKPKLGQLVLIVDSNAPTMKWALGRIVDVHAGQDGIIRVATVRTAHGVLKRGITKLCPLPVEEDPGNDAS